MGARGPLPKAAAERQNRNPHALTVVASDVGTPPAPPSGLLKPARDTWLAFWTSDVAAAVDRRSDLARLERWISDVDELGRVIPTLRKKRVVEGSQGQPVLNPLAAYVAQLEGRIADTEKQFGMTPNSRARLGLTQGQAKLTAAQLNAMLDRRGPNASEEDADWEDG